MKKQLGINLLKKRKILSEKEFLREKKFLRYGIIGFVVVMVLVVVTLSYQLILSQKLVKLEEEIVQITSDVSKHAEASAQQIYLKSRLELISSFLDVRSVAREAIQEIFSINISGVVVSGVSFESDNIMSAQFNASDVLSLERILEYLQEDNGVFRQVVSQGIIRTGEGEYQLQVLLTLLVNELGE